MWLLESCQKNDGSDSYLITTRLLHLFYLSNNLTRTKTRFPQKVDMRTILTQKSQPILLALKTDEEQSPSSLLSAHDLIGFRKYI